MMQERKTDAYDEMLNQRVDIARVQLKILGNYEPKLTEDWLNQLFEVTKPAYKSPSEHNLEMLDKCIKNFGEVIENYRKAKPKIERFSEEMRTDIKDLSSRLTELNKS